MRVLVVSQYYPPEGAYLPASLAQGLAASGHQVRVLTGFPNYPNGEVFAEFTQQWRAREILDGIDVLRVPLWADHSRRPLRRVANYLSFGFSSATARGFASGADVIYVYATQMTPALGPWLWRITGGAPYVLHVQDLWPDSITGSSLVGSGRAVKAVDGLLTPWLASVYHRSAAVIGIAPTMLETLAARGVPRAKLHLVYNWADEDEDEDRAAAAVEPLMGAASDSGARILYAGNVGDMQALEFAVEAAHNARDAGVSLRVVGDGTALGRVREFAARLDARNVEFCGRVPRAEMAEYYAHADYALVTLKDLPAFRGTIPSKVQSSLANGLPLITAVQGDVRAIVEEARLGHTADSESAASLEEAFRRAASDSAETRREMSRQAIATYAERFSRLAAVAAIEVVLMQATQG